MRKLPGIALAALILVVLPSCDDGTTTPNQPAPGPTPSGPAQVTVTVQFSQATASALFNQNQFQNRSAQGTMFFFNEANLFDGDLDGYLLVGDIQGDRVLEADVTLDPPIRLPSGAETSVSFDQDFIINDPALFRGSNNPGMDWQLQARISNGAGGTQTIDVNGRIGSGLTRRPEDSCPNNASTLCLGNNNRFQVGVDWRDFNDNTGSGTVSERFGTQGGSFYFFNPNTVELLIDVVDNCAFNNNFWVFAAATTNVEYTITVTDTETGTIKTYNNPLGQPAQAITDTQAFATCPGPVPVP